MKRLGSGYPNLVVSREKASATDTSHIVDSDPRADSTLIYGKPQQFQIRNTRNNFGRDNPIRFKYEPVKF